MIVSFSGRKGTGKTTLANLLIGQGFKKISFADRLKQLVSQLYGWSIEELNCPVRKEEILTEEYLWNKDIAANLQAMIGAVESLNGDEVCFQTRRHALQHIGTDVLRKYKANFHVEEFKKQIIEGENYVLDDARFPNELQVLKEMGSVCIFIMRPFYFHYNNHASEISLTRKDFDLVIINDRSEKQFIKTFKCFYVSLTKVGVRRPFGRDDLLEKLKKTDFDTGKLSQSLGCSTDKIVWWARRFLIRISRNQFHHNQDAFFYPTPEAAYWAGVISADGCVKKHYESDFMLELSSTDLCLIESYRAFLRSDKNIWTKVGKGRATSYGLCISCPYLIDDMKLWCIEPRKSRINKVPDCIRGNRDLLPYWIVGLIDGDGCISVSKLGCLRIRVLVSEQIVDFIASLYEIKSCKYQEKKIDNLYGLNFSGKNAVKFYHEVYRGMGLQRKWKKVEPFLNKKWHH